MHLAGSVTEKGVPVIIIVLGTVEIQARFDGWNFVANYQRPDHDADFGGQTEEAAGYLDGGVEGPIERLGMLVTEKRKLGGRTNVDSV